MVEKETVMEGKGRGGDTGMKRKGRGTDKGMKRKGWGGDSNGGEGTKWGRGSREQDL